jgi:hypothetical protein
MKKKISVMLISFFILTLFCFESCDQGEQQKSDSGVSKASVAIPTNPATGMTSEQENIAEKNIRDSKPGSIKHLYVISSYSGECLIYSTVKGKVTSGGKRLSPSSINGDATHNAAVRSNWVQLNGESYTTDEVMDEYGTYGSSNQYLYWFDTKGQYHQIYPSGGIIIFISENPVNVKSVNINLSTEK